MVKHHDLDENLIRGNWQSAEAWLNRKKQENICCPYLSVVACADTDEHKHLLCSDTVAIIANDTIVNLCLADFSNCVNLMPKEK